MHGVADFSWFLTAQVPDAPASGGSLPFMDDLIRGGPYGFIVILLFAVHQLYKALVAERTARMADRDKADQEKQALNDKILEASRQATAAVVQNTEVQRQIMEVIKHAQEGQ